MMEVFGAWIEKGLSDWDFTNPPRKLDTCSVAEAD
jgi:hypothetical protein